MMSIGLHPRWTGQAESVGVEAVHRVRARLRRRLVCAPDRHCELVAGRTTRSSERAGDRVVACNRAGRRRYVHGRRPGGHGVGSGRHRKGDVDAGRHHAWDQRGDRLAAGRGGRTPCRSRNHDRNERAARAQDICGGAHRDDRGSKMSSRSGGGIAHTPTACGGTYTHHPRFLRVEVDERVNSAGEVEVPVDEDQLRRAAEQLLDQGAESVAVTFLNSYVNPANELSGEAVPGERLAERVHLTEHRGVSGLP